MLVFRGLRTRSGARDLFTMNLCAWWREELHRGRAVKGLGKDVWRKAFKMLFTTCFHPPVPHTLSPTPSTFVHGTLIIYIESVPFPQHRSSRRRNATGPFFNPLFTAGPNGLFMYIVTGVTAVASSSTCAHDARLRFSSSEKKRRKRKKWGVWEAAHAHLRPGVYYYIL